MVFAALQSARRRAFQIVIPEALRDVFRACLARCSGALDGCSGERPVNPLTL